ncbi:helicase-related protein [Noviherbaspirillum sp.]|jgi:superfamily II DNA or RNA helicase|uniref:helicase-related protein n=1 Tax=Noviherbaspirillum sp. TaxID=1926288 RepID=UPI0025F4A7E5|nr:helicase-related protein [Noviherbaspirillum sp.]
MPDLLTGRLRATTESRFEEDWERQRRTAADILQRMQSQEGVILADQVGMGKTYVALAVAVSQILSTVELGQVVIFVPAAVADKWVREWRKFSESLLEPGTGIRCVDRPVRSGEEFFKKLDDRQEDRKHIIVVTHTALTATLKDTFIQLALLHYATRYVREGTELRQRIAKWSTGLTGLIRNFQFTPDRVTKLLDTAPSKWRETWRRLTDEDLPDDPVPEALEGAVRNLDLQKLRTAIDALPIRSSADINRRLETARKALVEITQATWKWMLSSTVLDLPLLIVDEAHRLKNPWTRIGKLFGERSKDADAGAFKGIFRRMLFLTATPFELGHSELIEVLTRMGAVRPIEPPPARPLKERLDELEKALIEAQSSALTLDGAWGRLTSDDLGAFDWWGIDAPPPAGASASAREAWEHAKLAVKARHKMHGALRPWVIRHERRRRRDYHPGAAIDASDCSASEGLQIPDSAALPFLLAARAQSIALDEKNARPLFAYGIASSYDAFGRLGSGQTDEGRDSDLPEEDRNGENKPAIPHRTASNAVRWYRSEIDRALTDPNIRDAHPKVRATVEKAAQLWSQGEKCLIFCWFIKTGEAVEQALAKRIDELIIKQASAALGTASVEETRDVLDRISDHLFRRDASTYGRIRQLLMDALIQAAGGHGDVLDLVIDAAIRHLRTPSYLVRYTRLGTGITEQDVLDGINGANPRSIVLLDRWRLFAERLARARNQIEVVNPTDEHDSEFARIKAALLGAHTEDDQAMRRGASLHPVRRAHGGTRRDVRERLIALFNTPFSPDLLVASSVMGEGIDLHQECRFVIHHDLDWNPSILEQRTGRLDRIGALAEREGKNIEVYEPYLAGTHDEKMFRVVKDRAQWFDVVMGRPTGADEHITDIEEKRVPLHNKIREALAMDLRSPERKTSGKKYPNGAYVLSPAMRQCD